MSKLANDQIYTLRVKDIQDAFESFSGQNGTIYCHKYILLDTEFGEEFICQWCNDSIKQNFCRAGDLVKVQIKKFTKNIYTIAPVTVLDESVSHTPMMEERQMQTTATRENKGPIGESARFAPNPIIQGSLIDRAMTNAIIYFKDNEVPFEKVTKYADEIYDWYLQKLQQ